MERSGSLKFAALAWLLVGAYAISSGCGGGSSSASVSDTSGSAASNTNASGSPAADGSTGGGSSSSASNGAAAGADAGAASAGPTPPAAVTAPAITAALKACEPSGQGRDYQVGNGSGQLPSLDQVPWESLSAGDTVRVFYRAQPYAGKFLISAQGTSAAPVRVCGVKGPGGERPVITGQDAVTRSNQSYGDPLHQSRSVIVIKTLSTQPWTAFPRFIQIDGLQIRSAHPDYQFTDTSGVRRRYEEFGACIWIERGQTITIADNEINDCNQAIFSRSTDDGEFAVTRNIRIAGNSMIGNGISGSDRSHTTYIQSVGVVYEFNRYGAMRAGAQGNAIKDRSVGTFIRYNRIEDGARAADLVEAEDYPITALNDPSYRTTFVYGNQIIKDGRKGSTIHYGGDHAGSAPGANWGEPFYRKGTLYFFNNTVRLIGGGYAVLFQLSTTQERAEVWNNVFLFDADIPAPSMRAGTDDIGAPWKPGGVLNLGRNWINANWVDSGSSRTVGGVVYGVENLITGKPDSVVDPQTLVPLAGSAVIDVGVSGPSQAGGYPVQFQLNTSANAAARPVNGAAIDLGAIER